MTVIAISVFPLNPAIVRHINDQGIVPNPSAFQAIQELPAGLVKPLAHGVVLGNEFAVHQLFVFVEQARGRCMGRMRQKGGIPDEEWLFLLLGFVDKIEHGIQSFSSDLQAIVPMPSTRFRVPPGHPMGESTPLIRTFPPFTALMT